MNNSERKNMNIFEKKTVNYFVKKYDFFERKKCGLVSEKY